MDKRRYLRKYFHFKVQGVKYLLSKTIRKCFKEEIQKQINKWF